MAPKPAPAYRRVLSWPIADHPHSRAGLLLAIGCCVGFAILAIAIVTILHEPAVQAVFIGLSLALTVLVVQYIRDSHPFHSIQIWPADLIVQLPRYFTLRITHARVVDLTEFAGFLEVRHYTGNQHTKSRIARGQMREGDWEEFVAAYKRRVLDANPLVNIYDPSTGPPPA